MIDNINVRDFLDDCERNGCVTHGEPFDIKYFEDKLIHTSIWKQLPDHAIQILEQAGYTKYDRNTDSIVFVEKKSCSDIYIAKSFSIPKNERLC